MLFGQNREFIGKFGLFGDHRVGKAFNEFARVGFVRDRKPARNSLFIGVFLDYLKTKAVNGISVYGSFARVSKYVFFYLVARLYGERQKKYFFGLYSSFYCLGDLMSERESLTRPRGGEQKRIFIEYIYRSFLFCRKQFLSSLVTY